MSAMPPCYVCEGKETIDSVLNLQLCAEQGGFPMPFIPLCEPHVREAEAALAEIRRIQTPPVIVKVSAPGVAIVGTRFNG